jgi:hypothetical protein
MVENASPWYPTALMIKTHNVTGKKYFCKTTKLDKLEKYHGSGTVWKRHLKVFGKDITTEILGIYYDKQRCVEAALKFSTENDIINSKEWANLILENGLDGASAGKMHHMYGKVHPKKGQKRPEMSEKLRGEKNPQWGKPGPMLGKKNPGASKALKGRKRPEGGGKPSKKVMVIDISGKKIIYESICEASRILKKDRRYIRKHINKTVEPKNGSQWFLI